MIARYQVRCKKASRTFREVQRRAHLENAPDCGRSPSAACRPAEADCKNSVLLRLAKRCEPGRFAVRRGRCQDAPPTGDGWKSKRKGCHEAGLAASMTSIIE